MIQIGYPFLFMKANLKLILKTAQSCSIVKCFLENHPEWLEMKIVCWTSRYRQLSLLCFIFTQKLKFVATKVAYRAHTVISNASRHALLMVLSWMHSNGELLNIDEPHNLHNP